MKKYKHLFFDIDKTLWDYESNVKEILRDVYNTCNLKDFSVDYSDFETNFIKYNDLLWSKFRIGQINKENLRDKRFFLTLKKCGTDNMELALKISQLYINISPTKTRLFPGVVETLEYLKDKYRLHIITNGFNEVQFKKLTNSGVIKYFENITTSDGANSQKPNLKIFHHALSSLNAKKSESVMIGDDWDIDIMGAKKYGFDQIYFNPKGLKHEGEATYEIAEFSELKGIF
jgi:putative hydrolase of the HAD superfamily